MKTQWHNFNRRSRIGIQSVQKMTVKWRKTNSELTSRSTCLGSSVKTVLWRCALVPASCEWRVLADAAASLRITLRNARMIKIKSPMRPWANLGTSQDSESSLVSITPVRYSRQRLNMQQRFQLHLAIPTLVLPLNLTHLAPYPTLKTQTPM